MLKKNTYQTKIEL